MKTHGMSNSSEYHSWEHAKDRCTNPKNDSWEDYGGRGIKFLFTSFEQFFAELGPKPKGYVIDRKDNNGNYEPGNVCWATRTQSSINQRIQKTNQSGTKGVHLHKGAWDVSVWLRNKKIHVGRFAIYEDAVLARREAEKKYYENYAG